MAKKSKKTKTKGTKDAAIEHAPETESISSPIALPDNETQCGKWDLKHIYNTAQLQGEEPTLCDGSNCRLLACSQWMCSLSGDIWNSCLDCQLERFQGWPKSKEDYPVECISDHHRRVMIHHCSSEFPIFVGLCNGFNSILLMHDFIISIYRYFFMTGGDNAITPRIPLSKDGTMTELEVWETKQTSGVDSSMMDPAKTNEPISESNSTDAEESNNEQDEIVHSTDHGEEEDEEPGEQWDIKHIFTIQEIENEGKQCETKNCPLKACSIWISSNNDEWNGCLDCQEDYYEKWPEKVKDYPVTFMSIEHREVIWDQCTGKFRNSISFSAV